MISGQKGVALITALFVVAIAVIAAAGMLSIQNVSIHRSQGVLNSEQSWWYALGVETWARQILRRDRADNNYDHLDEAWLESVDFLPVEGGFIAGSMIDMNRRFNVNNVVQGDSSQQGRALKQLEAVLENTRGIGAFDARSIAQLIADWVDDDQQPRFPDGAEDGYYLGMEIPYRTPNSEMATPAELALLRGVTAEQLEAMSEALATLPGRTAINVNTADVTVLAALSTDFTMADAEKVASDRRKQPFATVNEFMNHPDVAGKGIEADDVSVSSDYFLLEATAQVGTVRTALYSLLHRESSGNTRVVTHSRGAF